ncbi:MAG: DinB family protein [Phycisphaerae bacterium]
MTTGEFARDFVEYAAQKLEQNRAQIARCAGLLSTGQLWSRVNPRCNSVANLILHLTGNIREWIVSGVGGEEFKRDRPAEFAARGPMPHVAVIEPFNATLAAAARVILGLGAAELATSRTIQGYKITAQVAVMHVVEHGSYHCGQIVHMAKAILDVDLSQYDEQGRRLVGPDVP